MRLTEQRLKHTERPNPPRSHGRETGDHEGKTPQTSEYLLRYCHSKPYRTIWHIPIARITAGPIYDEN